MSPLMKNIAIVLGVITVAYFGYYIYSQNQSSSLSADSGTSSLEEMLSSTRIFIERRQLLDQVSLDTQVFSDPLFLSYVSFSRPLGTEAVGRTNPFVESTSIFGVDF